MARIECILCGKQVLNLNSHMQGHNIPRANWKEYAVKIDDIRKLHKCMAQDFCNYQTVSKSNLNKHIKTHDLNGNTYSCEVCNKMFLSKSGVENHKLSQHSSMRFVCKEQECNKTFVQMKSFRKHMEIAHEGYFTSKNMSKAYKCTLCLQYFIYMKPKHLCITELPPQYIKVAGFQQFPLTPEQLNMRRKRIEEQHEIQVEIQNPMMDFQDDIKEEIDTPENPEITNMNFNINIDIKEEDMDDIEEELETPENPQSVKDEITNLNYDDPSMAELHIKIEMEEDPIEAHATRSAAGCKVIWRK